MCNPLPLPLWGNRIPDFCLLRIYQVQPNVTNELVGVLPIDAELVPSALLWIAAKLGAANEGLRVRQSLRKPQLKLPHRRLAAIRQQSVCIFHLQRF